MRRLSIFGHGIHPCAWAAIAFAASLVTGAGIGMVTDGGGFFIYGIPVSGDWRNGDGRALSRPDVRGTGEVTPGQAAGGVTRV